MNLVCTAPFFLLFLRAESTTLCETQKEKFKPTTTTLPVVAVFFSICRVKQLHDYGGKSRGRGENAIFCNDLHFAPGLKIAFFYWPATLCISRHATFACTFSLNLEIGVVFENVLKFFVDSLFFDKASIYIFVELFDSK